MTDSDFRASTLSFSKARMIAFRMCQSHQLHLDPKELPWNGPHRRRFLTPATTHSGSNKARILSTILACFNYLAGAQPAPPTLSLLLPRPRPRSRPTSQDLRLALPLLPRPRQLPLARRVAWLPLLVPNQAATPRVPLAPRPTLLPLGQA